MDRFCPNCGSNIETDDQFCVGCGNKLGFGSADTHADQKAPQKNGPKFQSSSYNWPLISLATVALVVATATISYFVFSNREEIPANESQASSGVEPGNLEAYGPEEQVAEDRGWLGVTVIPVAEGAKPGAQVKEVKAGGPADEAGIRAGDIILVIGNDTVESPLSLSDAVSKIAPDRTVPLMLLRNGRNLFVTARVAAHPGDFAQSPPAEMSAERDTSADRTKVPDFPDLPEGPMKEFFEQFRRELDKRSDTPSD